jgi:exodeoxyribonuclease VII large subunit
VKEIERQRLSLDGARSRLEAAVIVSFGRKRDRLENTAKLLTGFSYAGVLARGFALVLDARGLPVRSTAQAEPGQPVTVKVSDGSFTAVVAGAPAPLRKTPKPPPRPSENDLFG